MIAYLEEHQGEGEVVTGLLYVDENVPDMHEMNETTGRAADSGPIRKAVSGLRRARQVAGRLPLG